jgi:hypothetical protein
VAESFRASLLANEENPSHLLIWLPDSEVMVFTSRATTELLESYLIQRET